MKTIITIFCFSWLVNCGPASDNDSCLSIVNATPADYAGQCQLSKQCGSIQYQVSFGFYNGQMICSTNDSESFSSLDAGSLSCSNPVALFRACNFPSD